MKKSIALYALLCCIFLLTHTNAALSGKPGSAPAPTLRGTGAISGTIVIGGQPASSTLVYIPGKSFMAYTDSNGAFFLYYVPNGDYYLVIGSEGFLPFTVGPYTVREGSVTTVSLSYLCHPEQTRPCELQAGVCSGSAQQCGPDGNWIACDYTSIPDYSPTEFCGDDLDNNCNDQIDEGCQVCSSEVCDNVDNNCDGYIDEGQLCGNYKCVGGVCLSSCAVDGDCYNGSYCSGSICVPKSPNGSVCVTTNQCLSGFCSDGYCCNSACGGACDTCAAALGAFANGTCTLLPAGSDGNPSCAPNECNGQSPMCPAQ